jgi:hypothetical protein
MVKKYEIEKLQVLNLELWIQTKFWLEKTAELPLNEI